jgi:hypothetical protein
MGSRILLAIIWLLFSLPSLAAGSPEITAADREYDFGEVLQGTKMTHTFVFQNSGGADLVIERVRSSCGCTAALLSSNHLPPGAEGKLEAVFESGRFRGNVSKTITLHTNVPETPRVSFVIRATVMPEVTITPDVVDFTSLVPGAVREMEVMITNRGEREVVLGTPGATNPEIVVLLAPGPLAPGASRAMTVRVVPSTAGGVSGYVMLRVDGAAAPDMRLSVRGRGER